MMSFMRCIIDSLCHLELAKTSEVVSAYDLAFRSGFARLILNNCVASRSTNSCKALLTKYLFLNHSFLFRVSLLFLVHF